jgi:hypothetical protein
MNPTMEEIETRAKTFAGARAELAERIRALRDEQEQAKRRRLQGIKNALQRATAAHDDLKASIEDGRALFDKPKTRILHGIKVGFMKQRGKLEIDDEDACVAALKKLFGEKDAEPYIKTTEKPIRAALETLPASDLKRLGVRVTEDVDKAVVITADAEIDKLIDALIGSTDAEAITS